MRYNLSKLLFFFFISFFFPFSGASQESKEGGPPSAGVVVAEIKTGTVAPESEFVGTVFYTEVSHVASEVEGKVETVNFEEGQRIGKGDVLVQLNSDLLEKRLKSSFSTYEEVLAEKEKAVIDLERVESLIKQGTVSEQLYDDYRFRVKVLEKKAASLKASVEEIEVELGKKRIKAPFNGVVIDKDVDRGEWVSPGYRVATLAKDDVVDVVVNIPEDIIPYTELGAMVTIKAGGRKLKGNVFAVIPRGDIPTRTFPVKIRVEGARFLKEGMSAKVILPAGEKKKVLMAPRDAVINLFGNTVVFVVRSSNAAMVPVRVIGYEDMMAGITAQGLEPGMKVVVKGNERLRDGQPVTILENASSMP